MAFKYVPWFGQTMAWPMYRPTFGIEPYPAAFAPGFAPSIGPGFGAGFGYAGMPVPMGPPPAMPRRRGWMYARVPFGDEEIREFVLSAIDADPRIPPDVDISVDVSGGVVTLTGTVPSRFAKRAAGDDAWMTPGVWDVKNDLQIVERRKMRRERAAKQ